MTIQKYITWSKMNVKEKLEQSSSILALQYVSLSSCVTLPSIRFHPPRRDTVLVADALVSHCCCISKCCCCCCMLLLLFFYLHGAIISTAITAAINSTATDRSVDDIYCCKWFQPPLIYYCSLQASQAIPRIPHDDRWCSHRVHFTLPCCPH